MAFNKKTLEALTDMMGETRAEIHNIGAIAGDRLGNVLVPVAMKGVIDAIKPELKALLPGLPDGAVPPEVMMIALERLTFDFMTAAMTHALGCAGHTEQMIVERMAGMAEYAMKSAKTSPLLDLIRKNTTGFDMRTGEVLSEEEADRRNAEAEAEAKRAAAAADVMLGDIVSKANTKH